MEPWRHMVRSDDIGFLLLRPHSVPFLITSFLSAIDYERVVLRETYSVIELAVPAPIKPG